MITTLVSCLLALSLASHRALQLENRRLRALLAARWRKV